MNEQELIAELTRYSAAPGYRFCAGFKGRGLVIVSRVPDSNNPANTVDVNGWFNTNSRQEIPAELLSQLIRGSLFRMAIHEVDEWLKRDGQRLNDPHRVGYVEPETVVKGFQGINWR